jgi:hypothetical protein
MLSLSVELIEKKIDRTWRGIVIVMGTCCSMKLSGNEKYLENMLELKLPDERFTHKARPVLVVEFWFADKDASLVVPEKYHVMNPLLMFCCERCIRPFYFLPRNP